MTDWYARVKNFFRTDRGDDLLSPSPMTLPPAPETPRRRLVIGVVALAAISLAALAGYARQHADAELALWWSQRRCQATWGAVVQPHGFGRWQQRGAVLDFFLECDSAADAPSRLTAAVAGYDELACANPQLATVTLLWMTTPEREAQARRTLHPRGCLIATATLAGGRNPAEAVWLPLGTSGPRCRLADLTDPHCWAPDRE